MKKLYISTVAAALLFTVSCQHDFENSTEDVVVTSGEANFSKYVSLGNSLTAGYRDGALYPQRTFWARHKGMRKGYMSEVRDDETN